MSNYNFPHNFHKARKQHRCSWCGHDIGIGEQYARFGQIHDGSCSTLSMHQDCFYNGWRQFSDDEWIIEEMLMGQPYHMDERVDYEDNESTDNQVVY